MNDSEIIAKYKKYEPFFKSWHIKRFIGEGGFANINSGLSKTVQSFQEDGFVIVE